MKKNTFVVFILGLFLTSCSPNLVDVKLDKFDLTITVVEPPSGNTEPEFRATTLDGFTGVYEFYVGKKRVDLREMGADIFPSDLEMLKTIITTGDNFGSMITGTGYENGTMKCDNGAFGIIYNKNKSNGKQSKTYVFYYEKNNRYFRITPILNNDLIGLDEQLDAIKSIK